MFETFLFLYEVLISYSWELVVGTLMERICVLWNSVEVCEVPGLRYVIYFAQISNSAPLGMFICEFIPNRLIKAGFFSVIRLLENTGVFTSEFSFVLWYIFVLFYEKGYAGLHRKVKLFEVWNMFEVLFIKHKGHWHWHWHEPWIRTSRKRTKKCSVLSNHLQKTDFETALSLLYLRSCFL